MPNLRYAVLWTDLEVARTLVVFRLVRGNDATVPRVRRQAVAGGGSAVSPGRWLSCGDLDAPDAEVGFHDNGGNLLSVSAANDGMMSSALSLMLVAVHPEEQSWIGSK